jgi:uncharacterized protein YeeX (DUF496 family)
MFPYLLYYKDWGFICLQNYLKKILKQDLSEAFKVNKKGNVICLEVGEHIPKKYKDVFVSRETGPTEAAALDDFKNVLLLKEVVATWVWYMLIGSITVSTSYMMMMNSDCTKTVDDYLMDRAKSTQ